MEIKKPILFISILALVFGCNSSTSKKPIKVREAYLREVISILAENSIYSEQTNWDSLKLDVNRKYQNLDNDSLKRDAVSWILRKHGFKHHGFMLKEFAQEWKKSTDSVLNENTAPKLENVSGKFIKPNIGYLNVPRFSNGDTVKLKEFAITAQKELKKLKEKGAEKWIVDLTTNIGGNMWPMLSGLGPLIGDGEVGFFISKSGETEGIWKIDNGSAYLLENDSITYGVKISKIVDNITNDKTALLLSEKTASSGEALLISFLGKENIKTFGTKTANYTTSNEEFQLSDGSILWVTTSYFADRNFQPYPIGITPMEEVDIDSILIDKAILWLNKTQE